MNINDMLVVAEKISNEFSRSYPGVSEEDLYQDLAVKLIEEGDRLIGLAREGGREDELEGLVVDALQKRAHTYCGSQNAQVANVTVTYYYRPTDVRRLLQDWTEPYDCWENAQIPDDAKSLRNHASVELLSDISRVFFTSLAKPYRIVVLAAHLLPSRSGGLPDWQEVGKVLGKSPEAVQMQYSRATEALCLALNSDRERRTRDHEGPGSRNLKVGAVFAGE